MKNSRPPRAGFTLLEVMIALAIVAIAMISLLSLHHQSLQSVIRSQDLTQAAFLAQTVITQAEIQGFPEAGSTAGDFQSLYPNQFPNYRWERLVEPTAAFPDVRKVRVRITFGPGFGRSFDLVEYLHNPVPAQQTTTGGANGQNGLAGSGGQRSGSGAAPLP